MNYRFLTLRRSLPAMALATFVLTLVAPAIAAPCGSGTFEAWLDDFKKEAASKGISPATIQAGLNGVTLDSAVLARDKSQKVFSQTFEEFSGRMIPPRMTRGSNMLKQYGSVLSRIRTGLRRAAGSDRRDLGSGNRFRRQHRKIPDHPLAGNAGL